MDLIASPKYLPSLEFEERNKIYYGFIHNFSSENTRKNYYKDLQLFLHFMREHFPRIPETRAEHAHLVAFKEYLLGLEGERKKGRSHRSVNRTLACLFSFYEYLEDLGIVRDNPLRKVRRFKVSHAVSTLDLTDEEVVLMLESVERQDLSGKLHFALLKVLFSTGMRHSELTHLRFSNLETQNELIVLRYKSKGDKEMLTPLHQHAQEALSDYLKACAQAGYSMEPEDYLFRPTKNFSGVLNKPLDSKSFDYIFKKYAKKAGVKSKVTPHSARATVIGSLLDKGISIDKVADFVGHKDISTTKSYNKRLSKLENSLAFELNF